MEEVFLRESRIDFLLLGRGSDGNVLGLSRGRKYWFPKNHKVFGSRGGERERYLFEKEECNQERYRNNDRDRKTGKGVGISFPKVTAEKDGKPIMRLG